MVSPAFSKLLPELVVVAIIALTTNAIGESPTEACASSSNKASKDHVLLQEGQSMRIGMSHDRQLHVPSHCTGRSIQRRRRGPESMCACRRRSGNEDLPEGWNCIGDRIDTVTADHEHSQCTTPLIQRRRYGPESMCACRRRSGNEDLPRGWECLADGIYKAVTSSATPSPLSTPSPTGLSNPCMCVFDFDRTITGKQENLEDCPHNEVVWGIDDWAYGGGAFTLSEMAREGINQSFCGSCYLGICSAGNLGGTDSAMRKYVLENLLLSGPFNELAARVPDTRAWSHGDDVRSPLVYSKQDRTKQFAIEDIRQWYKSNGIDISAQRVHFFGDRTENIEAFEAMNFNAREVSCSTRDEGRGSMIGFCGATPQELVDTPGVQTCMQQNVGTCVAAAVQRRRRDGGCYCRRRTGRDDDSSRCGPDNFIEA